jgi:hypothetical protein
MAEESSVTDPEMEACLLQIAGARERLGLALALAKARKSMNPLDWRTWVRKHPVECVLGAAAAGFVLSGPVGSSRDEGRGTVLEEITRAGLDRGLELILKNLL